MGGTWYSDDKKTAFKVLERDEISTFIKIKFGSAVPEKSEANDKAEIRQENRNVHLASQGKIDYDQVDKQSSHEEQNAKMHASIAVTKDEFQNQLASKIDVDPMQEQRVESILEINDERSRDAYHNQNINGRIASLLRKNAAFFVAVSILNFLMAVLITIFCFIFPNAFENVKLSLGKAWGWLKLKFDSGISYGLELPNLGMRVIKVGASPFDWMWRFLGCVGKCFGISLPSITM